WAGRHRPRALPRGPYHEPDPPVRRRHAHPLRGQPELRQGAGEAHTGRDLPRRHTGSTLMRRAIAFAAATLAMLACTNAGEGRLLTVSADGIVKGFIFSDADGNRAFSQGDDSVKSMTVRLITLNGSDTVSS